VVSRNNFLYIGDHHLDLLISHKLMIKLNQKKIDWIIKQKEQRVSSSEMARIQKITTRYVNMIYGKYKKYGEIIVNDPERKIKYQKIKKIWC
jgi:hypothetical protein